MMTVATVEPAPSHASQQRSSAASVAVMPLASMLDCGVFFCLAAFRMW